MEDAIIVHFNWKFWAPVKCLGGWVVIGWYVEVVWKGKRRLQTMEQFRIKDDMGVWDDLRWEIERNEVIRRNC